MTSILISIRNFSCDHQRPFYQTVILYLMNGISIDLISGQKMILVIDRTGRKQIPETVLLSSYFREFAVDLLD